MNFLFWLVSTSFRFEDFMKMARNNGTIKPFWISKYFSVIENLIAFSSKRESNLHLESYDVTIDIFSALTFLFLRILSPA
jgi:hypothetical protein